MIVRNAKVLCGDFQLRRTDVRIENGVIAQLGALPADGAEELDAAGKYLLPGLIDTHTHGMCGVEFSAPDEDFDAALLYEARMGVTTVAPTTRCLPPQEVEAAFVNIRREAAKHRPGRAHIGGIHAEGPFISPARKGAADQDKICAPDTAAFAALCDAAGGMLKILTLAPELPGADALIGAACARGVTVSLGHTDAAYEEAVHAIELGARQATHTCNAMRPFRHRDPGVLGAVLLDGRVRCEMICDLVHLALPAIRLIYALKGAENINMVSDTGKMSGFPDGTYTVDGRPRIIRDGVCRLPDGTIAGSTRCLYDGVKNMFDNGFPLEDIFRMAAFNPARTLGIDGETGSIAPGKRADLLLADGGLGRAAVFVAGVPVR